MVILLNKHLRVGDSSPPYKDGLRNCPSPGFCWGRLNNVFFDLNIYNIRKFIGFKTSGSRIRTYDLKVMSLASYQTALSRTCFRGGVGESNPSLQLGRLRYYHYTNSALL
jgi:hypothetical protein